MSCDVDDPQLQANRIWVQFKAALSGMVPEARAAFLLHEVFETTYEDTARLIGLPAAACRVQAQRARAQVVTQLLGAGLLHEWPEP
jgi:RNA polymerase sigma-70 factor (ECF subfamily)